LEAENQDLRGQLAQALQAVATLQAEVRTLRAEVVELRAQLGQNSSNSSRPPSSDPPGAVPRRSREPTGKPRGAQPGHKKHERRMLEPERVRKVVQCRPQACRRCGRPLGGDDPQPLVHQVLDVPPAMAFADEYRLHRLHCTGCGITTQGELPQGVPTTMVGPRLQAIIGVCSGAFRLSKRMTQDLLCNFFDVELSLGSIAQAEQAVSCAVAPAVAQAHAAIQQAPVAHADETSWRETGKKAWLWLATTAQLAVFLIRHRRSGACAKALLGAHFAGILCTDRWSAYQFVPSQRRQLCWAHLLRDFQSFADHGDEAKQLGHELVHVTRWIFRYWHRVRDGTLARSTFRVYMCALRRRIDALLRRGAVCSSRKVAGTCRDILAYRHALWAFVRSDGVEPTNNAAERALRHAVVWRKSSYGSDSEPGSRFVERILTVVQTLRLQQRNVLDYVTAACEAAHRGLAPPSLLPERVDLAVAA
jgi:transposase